MKYRDNAPKFFLRDRDEHLGESAGCPELPNSTIRQIDVESLCRLAFPMFLKALKASVAMVENFIYFELLFSKHIRNIYMRKL